MRAGLALRLPAFWQRRGLVNGLLWPLSLAFTSASAMRRNAFRRGLLRVDRLPVPVLVVGNLTVGGAGKTPLVIELARLLREKGWRPGVASRGYGGRSGGEPRLVDPDDDPLAVGDEPVLTARRAQAPVAVCPRRAAAAQLLIERAGCDLILADDGLQHYALARDVEIAVVDGETRLGNGWCLPAGPLREPPGRLQEVDFVVCNGGRPLSGETPMALRPSALCGVGDFREQGTLAELRGQRVHGVAGIGRPGRFFATLRELGAEPIEHPFPDHHRFSAADLAFDDALPVIMTEKDAVKCRVFANPRLRFLRVDAQLGSDFIERLVKRLP